jgi:TolB-like protein
MAIQAETPAPGVHELPVKACRAQLALILDSIDFDATGRERRFLSHVVEEALSGRGDRIKAYSIAVEVFGRGEAFDPQTDPIVRIEAGHLRRALERYYLTAGHTDPILITIPKGGYVPAFSLRSPSALEAPPLSVISQKPTEFPARRMPLLLTALGAVAFLVVAALVLVWSWTSVRPGAPVIPRVLVEKFDDLTGTQSGSAIAIGLKQEIVVQLSKFKDIAVMETPANGGEASLPRFVLSGSVNLAPDAFWLRMRLVNRADGSILWSESYNGGLRVADLVKAQADIASKVATSLAQAYGVIFQADAKLHVSNPPDDWAAYSCTLSFYEYKTTLDPITRASVRTCLEKTVDHFPDYATAWGLLSLIYIDDYRFEIPADPASSAAALEFGLAAARKAVEADPLNVRGRQAEMLGLYFSKEIDAALSVGKQALAINPNDTNFMGEYGERLALSGNWHEGCALLNEARERNPGALRTFEADLALCSYFSGDYQRAAMWLKRSAVPSNPLYHLIAAAVFGEAGNKIEADRERDWLVQNAPNLVKTVRQQVSMRLARSQDVEFVIRSLKKAGFDVAD